MFDSLRRRRTDRLSREEAVVVARGARAIDPPRPRRVEAEWRVELGAEPLDGASSMTLLVFLSSSCDGCADLATLVRDGVEGCSVLGALRSDDAAPRGWGPGPWLVSDAAFARFGVASAPFFCLVDADGTVVTEGVAISADDVRALVRGVTSFGQPAPARPRPARP